MREVKINSYLHDMIKAFLTYEPELARKLLNARHPHWRIFSDKYTVIVQRPEVGMKKFVDVVWVLKPVDKEVERFMLLFEIKTGKFTQKWIDQLEEVDKYRRHID